MKKTPIILLAFCCFSISGKISAATIAPLHLLIEKKTFKVNPALPYYFSVQDFLSLTPEKYKRLTGKKLSFFQKISLRLQQQKIKRSFRKKEPVILSDFDPTGFVLGLFISLVGIGISYLINYKDTKKWAWIGAGIGGIFILIALLL